MNKERITKGKQYYKYESAMYGCYDKGVAPHPEWDVPKEYEVQYAGIKGGKVVKQITPQYYIASREKVVIFSATYHPYKDFFLPEGTTLISPGGSSAKLRKNKRVSIVLYMSPVKRNSFGMNTCPMASTGCMVACLDYSGQKIPQGNQRLALARTDFYFAHREAFWQRIHADILKEHKKLKAGDELAVRLNGTSDLPLFEEYCQWCVDNDKVKNYPKNILFYDYTKMLEYVTYSKEQELLNPLKRRHKVTYSLSEKVVTKAGATGFDTAKKVLLNGGSVAAVFLVKSKGVPEFNARTGKKNVKPKNWVTMSDGKGGKKYYAPLPETATFEYEGKRYRIPVYDGDSSDDQMLDLGSGTPYILGLRAKARAERDTSGFAIPLFAVNGEQSTDPQIKEFELELRRNQDALAIACGLSKDPVQRFECPPDQTGKTIKTW